MQGTKFLAGVWGKAPSVTPVTIKKEAVSEQNAKHSTIETGLCRKAYSQIQGGLNRLILIPTMLFRVTPCEGWGYGGFKAACSESGDASLPDSCFFMNRFAIWGYDGVATPYPAWGFTPNPSKELRSLHPLFASRRLKTENTKGSSRLTVCSLLLSLD